MFGIKPILSLADAQDAIARIVREGEGTPPSPEEGTEGGDGNGMARYYSFYQIYKGRKIAKAADGSWYFTDEVVPFDSAGVQTLIDDPKQADYAAGSVAAVQSEAFNTYCSNLLKALHQSFNGNPDKINDAIGLMFDLKIQAKMLMQLPMDGHPGKFCAPTWQYIP